MLVRLDEIDGIERSFADRSGTLIRVDVASNADQEGVAQAAMEELQQQERNPVQLTAAEAAKALGSEEWREAHRVRELFAIEFRILAMRGLLVLIAVGTGIVMSVLWWRKRRRRLASPT